MPNRQKLYNALKQEGYDNFKDESEFNSYVSDANNRKKLFEALKQEGYDNFENEKSFDEYLGYGEPYTHEYDEQGNLVGGTAYQVSEPYEYKPEVQQRILENKPDMFKPKTVDMYGAHDKEKSELDLMNEGRSYKLSAMRAASTVGEQLDERIKANDEALKKAYAKREKPIFGGSGIGIGRAYSASSLEVGDSEEIKDLKAEQEYLSNAKKVFEAAKNDAGFFQGMKDAVDSSYLSFGMSDLQNAERIANVQQKLEAGQTLSESEQSLLTSLGLQQMVNEQYNDMLGSWYKAGMTTAEMLPFMAEMGANPLSGFGKAAMKASVKKFGEKGAKAIASKILSRTIGDVAGAAGMAATTGLPSVMADALERQQGYVTTGVEGGAIKGTGLEGGETASDAWRKAFTSRTIENWSEMVGEYFSPVGNVIGKGVKKGLGKIGLSKVTDFIDGVQSSNWAKLLDDFSEQTQWNGSLGEFAEEQVGMIADALLVGDTQWSDLVDAEKQLDVALGVGVFGTVMSLLRIGGYRTPKYRARKAAERADNAGKETFGAEQWNIIKASIDNAESDEQMLADLSGVFGSDATEEQKKAAFAYANALKAQQAVNTVKEKQKIDEPGNVAVEAESAYDAGAELQEPQEKHQAKQELDRAEVALGSQSENADEQEFAQMVMNGAGNPVETVNAMAEQGYSDEQIQKAKDYYTAYHRLDGLTDAVMDRVDAAVERADAEVDANINKQSGAVVQVILRDGSTGYVVDHTVVRGEEGSVDVDNSDDTIVVRLETGESKIMNPNKDLLAVSWMESPETLKNANHTVLRKKLLDKEIGEIDWNPATPNPKVGDSFEMDGVPVTIVSHNGKGGMFVVPTEEYQAAAGNEKKMQELAVKAQQTEAVPAKVYKDWASAQIDAQEQAQAAGGENLEGYENSEVGDNAAMPMNEGVGQPEMVQEGAVGENPMAEMGKTVPEKRPMNEDEAATFVSNMGMNAEPIPEIEFTPENWQAAFGEDGTIETPIGTVKMGENQISKLFLKKRTKEFGMIAPTLSNPDIIIEEKSRAKEGKSERESSYLFIKTFIKNGEKVRFYTSVTVLQDGMEVSVSSHVLSEKQVPKKLTEGNVIYIKEALSSNSSDGHLAEQPNAVPDLLPTQEDNASSDNKGNAKNVQEQGNQGDFVAMGAENALKALGEKYGEKMPRKVEVTAKAYAEDLKKAQRKLDKAEDDYDNAPIGREDKAEKARDKARAEFEAVRRESDFWAQLDSEIKAAQVKPGDAVAEEIISMEEPMNGEEFAAQMLANGNIKLLQGSFAEETGFGKEEAKKYFGLFASADNGGLSVSEAGERLMEADRENGTNFFDQNDPNAGRNALIEVLSMAKTRWDLANFIKNNRAEQAKKEQEAEYAAYEAWAEENFHMSVPDYEAYEEVIARDLSERGLSEEDYQEFRSTFVDETLNTVENGQQGIDIESKGGGEVLPDAQSVPTGRASGIEEESAEVDGGVAGTDRAVLEGASGSEIRYDNQGNPIDGQGKLIIEPVNSIDEITDEDFISPTRSVSLPNVPQKVADAIGTGGKPIIIKKNIFEKNKKSHKDLTPVDGRTILAETLFNPNLYGQNQKATRPYNWILIHLADKHSAVIVEVNQGKDFVEIVNWHYLNDATLEQKKNQAIREGGLILTFGNVAGNASDSLASEDKGSNLSEENKGNERNVAENEQYTIEHATYTTKRGKVLDMFLVKPMKGEMSRERQTTARILAKNMRGWYDRNTGGWMLRSKEDAQKFADEVFAVSHSDSYDLITMKNVTDGDVTFSEPVKEDEYSPTWQYVVSVDKETGFTTLRRDDVSGAIPVGDARFTVTATSPQEILDILRNPMNGMQEVLDAVGVTLENKVKMRTMDAAVKETPKNNPSGNKLVSDERYAELRERMRKKLGGQINMGIDPEILAIGTEMAVYHIEKGARKFVEYAQAMIADLGDAIRPYLKAFYNGARDLPEMRSEGLTSDMTPYEEVSAFDVANFDKPSADVMTAVEAIAKEQEVEQQAEVAKERVKKQRKTREQPKRSVSLSGDLFNSNNVTYDDGRRNREEAKQKIAESKKKIQGLEKAMKAPWGREEELKKKEQEVADLKKQLEEKAAENTRGTSAKESDDTLYRSGNLEDVNEEFNKQLDDYVNNGVKSNTIFKLGNPNGAMKLFLPDLPIVMRPRIINKSSNTKHNVNAESLRNLPIMISEPIFVFRKSDNALGVLTEIKDRDGKNVCVAIELNKTIQDGGTMLEVNDIRSIHGRETANLILPIVHNNTLVYADKKKGLTWLSSASYNYQQEIDKKDLDSAAKIVESFENPKVEEENNYRKGEGALTADEVSMANDPIGKILGQSTRTAGERKNFAERERKRMVERVESLAKKLRLNNVDIVTDADTLSGAQRNAKGFYSRSKRKITIVIPNHSSVFDAEQTLLHEAVAHYGLRELFGTQFDVFLDNVYNNAAPEVRERINQLAMKNGWDFPKATEEYLASLAEDTNFDNVEESWWGKIKQLFLQMLHSIGFEGFTGVTLTDNELRYILWRSYENLAEPGKHRSILGEAADIAKQNQLKVGNYSRENYERERERLLNAGRTRSVVAESDEYTYTAEDVIADFEEMVGNHPGMYSVRTEEDIDALPTDRYTKRYIKEKFNNPRLAGTSVYEDDMIVLFPNHVDEVELRETIPHELAHFASRNLKLEESYKMSALDYLRKRFPDSYKKVMEYSKEKWGEEAVAYLFEEKVKELGFERILNGKFDTHNDIGYLFYNITNYLNHGRRNHPLRYGRRTDSQRTDDGRGMGKSQTKNLYGTGELQVQQGTEESVFGNDRGRVDRELGTVPRSSMGAGTESRGQEEVEGDTLYRPADKVEVMADDTARKLYEDAVKTKKYRFQEGFQDAMLSLKKLQEAIVKQHGGKLEEWEDAYTAENQMSSRDTAEVENFTFSYFKPMMKEAANILNRARMDYKSLRTYLIAKSGLERNRDFAVRDALAEREKDGEDVSGLYENYMQRKKELLQDLEDETITFREYCEAMDNEATLIAPDKLGKDYSGLTALFGEDTFTEKAIDEVEIVEGLASTKNLWKSIKRATRFSLDRAKQSGVMSTDAHKKVSEMFEWYVPMRGWNDTKARDVYEYFGGQEGVFNPTVKTAGGRTSLSDDPLATIANMAESAIFQGNKNQMKQKLLNLAFDKPTNLITVMDSWIENKGTEDSPKWEYVYPPIEQDDDADVIAYKIKLFEEEMQQKKDEGRAKKLRGKADVPYIATPKEIAQHIVRVKRNGREFVMIVNGNPRAAQAINGMTNPETYNGIIERMSRQLNQFMAAAFTTKNPTFIVRNLSRDLIFSNTAVAVKENVGYGNQFRRNQMKVLGNIRGLMKRYQSGKLDMDNELDKMFAEFIKNGGETGFAQLTSVDEYKKKIQRELKDAKKGGQVINGRKVGRAVLDTIEFYNRCSEDVSRFTVYMTSRQMGRSIQRSVGDAKEITVNFNKRGSGSKAGGFIGFGAQSMRSLYLFFNAAVQALVNFKRLGKKHPVAFTTALTMYAVSGFLMPVVNEFLSSMLGGDDDDYDNLPEWIRRNNLVFFLGKWRWGGDTVFLTIPLPVEMRAFYGLGEAAYQLTAGNVRGKDAALQITGQFAEMLPLNFVTDAAGPWNAFTPDAFKPIAQAYISNKDWTGKPIYRDNGFNKELPEWTKAYAGTSKWLVDSAELMNELTGGDKYKSGVVDINPARLEHLFTGYFGGFGDMLLGAYKTASMYWHKEYRNVRNIPVLKAFLNQNDERTGYAQVKKDYATFKKEYEDTVRRLNGYNKEMKRPETAMEYAERMTFLHQSKQMKHYVVMRDYERKLSELYKLMRENPDEKAQESIMNTINQVKADAVKRLRSIDEK